jgi:cytochrome b561
MQFRNTQNTYGLVPQALHWSVVALVVLAWLLGSFDDALPKGAARDAGLFVHISAGLAVIALVALRLLWRLGDPPPPPERTILGDWADRAARLVHYLLYALVIAVPVVGIVLQFARGDALPVFGLFEIAPPFAPSRPFARSLKEVHEVLANGLIVLAGLHAAAALVHHWIFRDRTLTRMVPSGLRSGRS